MGRDIDLAWLAGLVDGEGCLLYVKHRPAKLSAHNIRHVPTLIISMYSPEAIERASEIIGAKVVVSKYLLPKPHTRWVVRAYGARLQALLEELLPYLTAKRQEAGLLLEGMRACPPLLKRGRLPGGGYPRLTEEQLALREGYYLALQGLK